MKTKNKYTRKSHNKVNKNKYTKRNKYTKKGHNKVNKKNKHTIKKKYKQKKGGAEGMTIEYIINLQGKNTEQRRELENEVEDINVKRDEAFIESESENKMVGPQPTNRRLWSAEVAQFDKQLATANSHLKKLAVEEQLLDQLLDNAVYKVNEAARKAKNVKLWHDAYDYARVNEVKQLREIALKRLKLVKRIRDLDAFVTMAVEDSDNANRSEEPPTNVRDWSSHIDYLENLLSEAKQHLDKLASDEESLKKTILAGEDIAKLLHDASTYARRQM